MQKKNKKSSSVHRKLDLYVCMISEELFPCLYIIAVVLRPRQFKSAEHRPNARSAPFSAADPSRRLPPATPSSSCWDLACSHQHHALMLTVLRLFLLVAPPSQIASHNTFLVVLGPCLFSSASRPNAHSAPIVSAFCPSLTDRLPCHLPRRAGALPVLISITP